MSMTSDDLRAKVFEDRITPGDWRVEKMDEDGGYEIKTFIGPDAREQAIRCQRRREYASAGRSKNVSRTGVRRPTVETLAGSA